MGAADHGEGTDAQAALPPARDVRYGAAVYGSFLAASVVGASYEAGDDARTMTATVFASMAVFWLAHAWSEAVGRHVADGPVFEPARVRDIARREWPLVEAAVVPTLQLALAWAGVWSRATGAALALVAAVLQITGWGILAGLRSGASGQRAALLGAAQGTLALALLALEWLIHH
jgi:hypothetical protein